MKIKDKRFKITALYERLSKDDEVQGESNSIVNQKRMGKYIDIFCNMECIIVFRNISDKFQSCEELKARKNLKFTATLYNISFECRIIPALFLFE